MKFCEGHPVPFIYISSKNIDHPLLDTLLTKNAGTVRKLEIENCEDAHYLRFVLEQHKNVHINTLQIQNVFCLPTILSCLSVMPHVRQLILNDMRPLNAKETKSLFEALVNYPITSFAIVGKGQKFFVCDDDFEVMCNILATKEDFSSFICGKVACIDLHVLSCLLRNRSLARLEVLGCSGAKNSTLDSFCEALKMSNLKYFYFDTFANDIKCKTILPILDALISLKSIEDVKIVPLVGVCLDDIIDRLCLLLPRLKKFGISIALPESSASAMGTLAKSISINVSLKDLTIYFENTRKIYDNKEHMFCYHIQNNGSIISGFLSPIQYDMHYLRNLRERNMKCHRNTKTACMTLVLLQTFKKGTLLNQIAKDIVKLLAKALFETKSDFHFWDFQKN